MDKNIAFRVLIYLINIMKHHQTQHPQESLPIVIPLVLYTGKPKWTAPLDIFPYFSGLMEYVFKHAQARDMRKVLES